MDEVNKLIEKFEKFNEKTEEDEIEELTYLAELIMDSGAGLSPQLKILLNDNTSLNIPFLNELLRLVNVKKMKMIYVTGILRYTFSHKEQLSNWNLLRDKAEKECLEKNLDIDDYLYGLKNE